MKYFCLRRIFHKSELETTVFLFRKFVNFALNMDVIFFGAKSDPKIDSKIEALEKLIDQTRFSIHHLTMSDFLKTPWNANSKLVVLTSDFLDKEHVEKLEIFQRSGGLVCSLSPNLGLEGAVNLCSQNEDTLKELPKELLKFGAESFSTGPELIGNLCHTNGTLLFSESVRSCVMQRFLVGQSLKNREFSIFSVNERLSEYCISKSSDKELYFTTAEKCALFDYLTFSQTFTKVIKEHQNSLTKNPPLVLHTEVLNSTMDVSKLLSDNGTHDVICVADVQLQGKGRRSNKWISNKGCAMMSFSLALSNSECESGNVNRLMTECPSTVQHLAAISVIKSLKALAPIETKLPVVIKWPNDIYVTPDEGKIGLEEKAVKVGGVLVNGEFCSDGQMKFLVSL